MKLNLAHLHRHMPFLMLFILLCVAGCNREKPLAIQIYYDPNGAFVKTGLERRTWDFSVSRNKTLDGRPLIVRNLSTNDYRKTLREVVPRVKPDLLILNSLADAEQFGSSVKPEGAKNLCAPSATCIAVIPTWVDADHRAATTKLLHYLRPDS